MNKPGVLVSLFRYKAWADADLLDTIATVDAAAHPDPRHLAIRLCNHMHVVDRAFAARLVGQLPPFPGVNTPETPTLEALRAAMAGTDAWLVDHVSGVPGESLAEEIDFVFADGANGRMTREEMLAHLICHGAYHRGAIGRILAQIDVSPPPDALTVHLHRTEPERRERR